MQPRLLLNPSTPALASQVLRRLSALHFSLKKGVGGGGAARRMAIELFFQTGSFYTPADLELRDLTARD